MSEGIENVNTRYKDRLFNFIFGKEENREWTLSLYNAMNGSHYTDASKIEFNTLENVLYMGMKNDTSFLISDKLSVYEHQSTFNPNMPLRLLEYVSKLYSKYISDNRYNKYGETLIMLPTPKLVVFYNGVAEKEDEVILRLSDSFSEEGRKEADIEVRVRMVNVNYGHNDKLMEACRPLAEYSWFIKEIRKNKKDYDMIKAVDKAIEVMPKDYIIRSFLISHKAEVMGMLDTEYNEEEVMELFKRDSFLEGKAEGLALGRTEGLAEGRSKGLAEGKSEALLYSVKSLMKNMNLTLENALDILGLKGEERKAVIEEIK